MYRIKLWNDFVPGFQTGYDNENNINCPSMDFYTAEGNTVRPAVLIIPGGAYDHRAEHEGSLVARDLAGNGYHAFVLNYRVAPYKHPIMLNDAQRAMRMIRFNAKRYNVDPDKIIVMGFSAGGNLAGILAENYDKEKYEYLHQDDIDEETARPNALVLCYTVSSNSDEYAHSITSDNVAGADEELKEKLSLEKNVRDDMPPTFLWHTFEDKSVNCIHSLRLAEALKEHNIPFEMHIFPYGRHGLGLATGIYGADQWFWLMLKWLKGVEAMNFGIQ